MSKKSKENAERPQAGYNSKADVQAAIDRELATRLGRGDTTVQALAWCANELVESKWLLFKMARAMGRRPRPLDNDHVCKHGVAWDVHCCNCHSGFIFERDHECPRLEIGDRDEELGITPRDEEPTNGR